MDRRSFIRLGTAGAVTGMIAPQLLMAGNIPKNVTNVPMAGGVFYTKATPGRWAKKAGAHSPILQKTSAGVKVITGHPMKPGKHWIVKHVLLDKNFNFISENIFDPAKHKKAVSEFQLDGQSDVVYALSVCNLHDTWLTALKI